MELFHNIPLQCAIIGWFAAEILKIIINVIKSRSFKGIRFKNLFASGGMPSSHSAAIVALTAAIGYMEGMACIPFAIAAVMSAIVMYDASGVRHETGEQAKALNKIINELFSGNPEYSQKAFKELIGHTKLQVFMGALLGLLIGILVPFWLGY